MGAESKMIELAESWIGRKESNGTHKYIIDVYNKHKPLPRGYKVKYTDSWCATTISALAIKCDYDDIIPIECSCQKMIELADDMGIWKENENCTPKPGWIVMYDWQDTGKGDDKGWADHVGLVVKVKNGKITVIEGNYGNAVKYRTLEVNGKYIRGYIVPNYPKEEYFPKYTGDTSSIVKALNELKIDSSKDYRKKIAKANGIKDYNFTAAQNTKMLKLLKSGKLIKP